MATKTETQLSSIKYNVLTKAQYDAAVENGTIANNEFYLITDEAVEINVDDALSSTSENPVQNKVIYEALQNVDIAVDDVLSSTSENPVQNKVIYEALIGHMIFEDNDIENGTVVYIPMRVSDYSSICNMLIFLVNNALGTSFTTIEQVVAATNAQGLSGLLLCAALLVSPESQKFAPVFHIGKKTGISYYANINEQTMAPTLHVLAIDDSGQPVDIGSDILAAFSTELEIKFSI